MTLWNQGVKDKLDIPIGKCNKIVFITTAGVETVFGSCKDAKATVTQTRYKHKDNAKFALTVGDYLMGCDGEGSFTLEEWNTANLAILAGSAAINGVSLIGSADGSEGRLEFFVDQIQKSAILAIICYKVKIYSEIDINFASDGNIPIPVKFTLLDDYNGEYGAPNIGDIRPLMGVTAAADASNTYGSDA